MTQSPNEAKSIDEILWYVYEAGAKSMEDGGGSDYEVNDAKSALRSLIKKEVIGYDKRIYHINKRGHEERVNGYLEKLTHNQLRAEQRAKLKEVMGGE